MCLFCSNPSPPDEDEKLTNWKDVKQDGTMEIHRIPESVCTNCGKLFNSTANPAFTQTPSKDDYSICLGCGKLTVFNGDLTLRDLTPEEEEEVRKDPEIMAAVTLAIIHGMRNR
jgi:hypothetical protein